MAMGKARVGCWRGVFQQKAASLSHPSGVGGEECYHPCFLRKQGAAEVKRLAQHLQGEGATREPGQVQPKSNLQLQSWAL